mgnify:CR=1 FL=1
MDQEELAELLRQGVVRVNFEKSDGSIREMNCTLHESKLPPPKPGATARPPKPDLMVCWDVDADGWRSFKLSRLTEEPQLVEEL